MQLGFSTDKLKHAQAALVLYAMYRSRDTNSALNGLETWNRFSAYIRSAAIKSTTTPEFVEKFCRMAKIGSIKPRYLSGGGDYVTLSDGSLIQSDSVHDYKTDVLSDNSLLPLFEREGIYLTMLVRERLQREKMENTIEEDSDDEN